MWEYFRWIFTGPIWFRLFSLLLILSLGFWGYKRNQLNKTELARKVFYEFTGINKLPKDISLRIVNKLKQVKQNPFHYLEHFEGGKCFKLRIGDYRAIVEANIENKILVVRILDKRGRIYKR